jgi:hypothetical protein
MTEAVLDSSKTAYVEIVLIELKIPKIKFRHRTVG